MPTLKPPDNILQMLQFHCEANDIALAMIGSDEAGVCMILFGNRNLSPDQASVMAAAILLQGVISGGFHQHNEDKLKQDETPMPKENLN